MGRIAFGRFPDAVEEASDHLGWRIDRLCLEDPDGLLGQTRYTQPALFLTCALEYRAWLEDGESPRAAAAGHSLGEYAALHAAGCFDLMTGLRLVAERGRLMAAAQGGSMSAVIGLAPRRLADVLADFPEIDVANAIPTSKWSSPGRQPRWTASRRRCGRRAPGPSSGSMSARLSIPVPCGPRQRPSAGLWRRPG